MAGKRNRRELTWSLGNKVFQSKHILGLVILCCVGLYCAL